MRYPTISTSNADDLVRRLVAGQRPAVDAEVSWVGTGDEVDLGPLDAAVTNLKTRWLEFLGSDDGGRPEEFEGLAAGDLHRALRDLPDRGARRPRVLALRLGREALVVHRGARGGPDLPREPHELHRRIASGGVRTTAHVPPGPGDPGRRRLLARLVDEAGDGLLAQPRDPCPHRGRAAARPELHAPADREADADQPRVASVRPTTQPPVGERRARPARRVGRRPADDRAVRDAPRVRLGLGCTTNRLGRHHDGHRDQPRRPHRIVRADSDRTGPHLPHR